MAKRGLFTEIIHFQPIKKALRGLHTPLYGVATRSFLALLCISGSGSDRRNMHNSDPCSFWILSRVIVMHFGPIMNST